MPRTINIKPIHILYLHQRVWDSSLVVLIITRYRKDRCSRRRAGCRRAAGRARTSRPSRSPSRGRRSVRPCRSTGCTPRRRTSALRTRCILWVREGKGGERLIIENEMGFRANRVAARPLAGFMFRWFYITGELL